jgi:hypothetical protein
MKAKRAIPVIQLDRRRLLANLRKAWYKRAMEATRSTETDLREQAIAQLKKKRDFRSHVFIYIAVNAVLVVIWAVTGSGFFWPIFPILGWGVGVAANAWDVYGRKPIGEDEIRRETERLRGKGTT